MKPVKEMGKQITLIVSSLTPNVAEFLTKYTSEGVHGSGESPVMLATFRSI